MAEIDFQEEGFNSNSEGRRVHYMRHAKAEGKKTDKHDPEKCYVCKMRKTDAVSGLDDPLYDKD